MIELGIGIVLVILLLLLITAIESTHGARTTNAKPPSKPPRK